jgi:hypothetical protein
MQSHYGTWMPIKEGATIPLASARSGHFMYANIKAIFKKKADLGVDIIRGSRPIGSV